MQLILHTIKKHPKEPKALLNILLKIAILALIDVLLMWLLFFQTAHPTDALTSVFVIIPVIISINLVLALAMFLLRQKQIGWLLLLNVLIAPIIYRSCAIASYNQYSKTHSKSFYFNQNGKQYELLLDRRDTSYSMFESGDGSSLELLRGRFEQHKDTIALCDGTQRMFIHRMHLVGYLGQCDMILLKE